MLLYFTKPKLSYLQNSRGKNFIPRSESKVFLTISDLKLVYTYKFHGRVFLSHTEPKNIGTILGL